MPSMSTRTLVRKLAFSPFDFSPLSLSRIVSPSLLASHGVRGCYWRQSCLFPDDLEMARCTKLLSGEPDLERSKDHRLVILRPPEPSLTKYQITVSYIKTLADLLGSEEEAKKSIYSVYRLAFGCTVSEELCYKIKTLPKVRWVIRDPFLDLPPSLDINDWAGDVETGIGKTEVRDNPQDRYVQRQSENMQKFDDGLIDDICKQTEVINFNEFNPERRNFLFQPTYQLVDKRYEYPGRVDEGYQGGSQGYQGGGQGYQERNLGGSMPGGSRYQANNSYQEHGPGYQGGAPDSGYQGDGAGPLHGQTGGSSSYLGGAGPLNFQTAGPGYQGIPNCHADGPYYQGRDLLKEAMAVAFKQVGQLTGPGYQGSLDYQGIDVPGRDQ